MFDIGWMELAIVAIMALIVIGPKDLPRVMRTIGGVVRKAQGLARDFRSSIDDMAREADLDDARNTIQSVQSFDLNDAVKKTVDPSGAVERDLSENPMESGPTIADPTGPSAPKAKPAVAPEPATKPAAKKPARRKGGAKPKAKAK